MSRALIIIVATASATVAGAYYDDLLGLNSVSFAVRLPVAVVVGAVTGAAVAHLLQRLQRRGAK